MLIDAFHLPSVFFKKKTFQSMFPTILYKLKILLSSGNQVLCHPKQVTFEVKGSILNNYIGSAGANPGCSQEDRDV